MRAARRGPWATPAPPPTPPPPLPPPPPPLLPLLLLLLAALRPARAAAAATGAPEAPPDRGAPQTGRLSLQDTAEIQRCLVNAGDVGCGVFECFENNSCEIRGLQGICLTFLHNAGKFDAQGKSFIKDALKCKAHALRHRFSCISRKCPAIKDMVFQLQRECYLKHDLCAAAQNNIRVMVEMIHFKDLLLQEPYVDLVNLLLTCGEEVREAVARSVQAQCEHDWGGLCAILSFCTSTVQRPPTAPPDGHPLGARARLSRTRQDAAGSSGDPGDRARPHPAGGPASHSREAEDSDLGR